MLDKDYCQKCTFPVQSGDNIYFLKCIKQRDPDINNIAEYGISIQTWNNEVDEHKFVSYDEAFYNTIKYISEMCTPQPFNFKEPMTILTYANDIANDTNRGSGNFIIATPKVVSEIKNSEHAIFRRFSFIPYPTPNNLIIMGYKGPRDNDAGIIFKQKGEKFFPILNELNSLDYYRVLQIEGE